MSDEALVPMPGDVVEAGPLRLRIDAVEERDGAVWIEAATIVSVDVARIEPGMLVYNADGTISGASLADVARLTKRAEGEGWVGDAELVYRAVEGAVEPSDKDDPLPPLPASTEPTDGDLRRAIRAWDAAMPGEAGMLEAEVEE